MHKLLIAILLAAATLPLNATEPNPSPRQRELILKLLETTNSGMNSAAVMDGFLKQFEKGFLDSVKGKDPDEIAEAQEVFAGFRERAASIDFGGLMRDSQVHIFAKYFTEEELADMVAFYATPTGRKSIQVMPQLLNEAMQAGAENIGPKLQEVMVEVTQQHEKKRPWRRTMSDMRSVHFALEAYALDHDDLYPTGDYTSLKETLADYLTDFPEKDSWGHKFAYAVSPDRKHFRVISAGADTNFEWDSRRIIAANEDEETVTRYRERLEDDLIFADGEFIQLPIQAKPKNAD